MHSEYSEGCMKGLLLKVETDHMSFVISVCTSVAGTLGVLGFGLGVGGACKVNGVMECLVFREPAEATGVSRLSKPQLLSRREVESHCPYVIGPYKS